MSPRPLAVLVLAAGKGTRTKVDLPKVLLPLCGRTLLETVLDTAAELNPAHTVVVVGHQKERVMESVSGRNGLTFVDQGDPKGTGHAVQVAMDQGVPADFDGDVLVLYGDVPLITLETLEDLRAAREDRPASLLTAFPDDPEGLGRILRDADERVIGIREEKDCSVAEREIEEINAGFYCFDAKALRPALAGLSTDNAQGEYYLTDAIGWFVQEGQEVESLELHDAEEIQGVNNLTDLANARDLMQEQILLEHLSAGVLIEDPSTTYIDHGVTIGRGTRVLPCTVIRRGVVIGGNCEVGPFSHLRVGAVLEDTAEVGNFVEMKKSTLGRGSKAKHLTYLGDAVIGAKANIGAGTITANYDGKAKHRTDIADRAFIGSGTVLVAPSTVGEGAMTGAGAIVTRGTQVGAGEVYVGVPARPLRRAGGPDRGPDQGDARTGGEA